MDERKSSWSLSDTSEFPIKKDISKSITLKGKYATSLMKEFPNWVGSPIRRTQWGAFNYFPNHKITEAKKIVSPKGDSDDQLNSLNSSSKSISCQKEPNSEVKFIEVSGLCQNVS